MKISEHYSSSGLLPKSPRNVFENFGNGEKNNEKKSLSDSALQSINEAAIYFSKMNHSNVDQIEEADKILEEMRSYFESYKIEGHIDIIEAVEFNSDKIVKLFL